LWTRLLSPGQSGRGAKLTTHLQLVPRSRKGGSTHPLPHSPSWQGQLYLLHVACMGEMRNAYTVLEGEHDGRLGVDEWIILKRISKKWKGRLLTGLFWFRVGTGRRPLFMW
jgi:hypothetical protein